MNKYKNKILVLLLIAFSPMISAQVYVGGGIGEYSLNNNYDNLIVSSNMGFNLKAGYVKMFSRKFGVGKVQINGPINGEYAYDFV
jgi:hypothetical protein